MSLKAEFCRNRATQEEIANHLSLCDANFVPPLSSRLEISEYAEKIFVHALRFEAWEEGSLVGLVAIYCNDTSRRSAYITSVSVLVGWQRNRVASHLIEQCLGYLRDSEFGCVELEVDTENGKAIDMYEKHGFTIGKSSGRTVVMGLNLGRRA